MITKEQYLEALEIVDLYHRQNQPKPEYNEPYEQEPVLLGDWIKKYRDVINVRTYNALSSAVERGELTFVDQLNKKTVTSLRHAGIKTWWDVEYVFDEIKRRKRARYQPEV